MNCNSIAAASRAATVPTFQSLIGILVNCNARAYAESALLLAVSIPNRDFGELQSDKLHNIRCYAIVSIPNRDFGELQSTPLFRHWLLE